MMQMPSVALSSENNGPGEKPQPNQEKSAEKNKSLRNGGSGGYQCVERILRIYRACAGKKNWSHHN